MKRMVCAVLSLLLFFGMSACTPSQTPSGGDKEDDGVVISPQQFFKTMKYDEGYWYFPGREVTYKLIFDVAEKKYMVQMVEIEASGNETVDNFEIVDITYSKDKKTYTVRLREEGLRPPAVNFILHVETGRIEEDLIYAENIFDQEKTTEYLFEKSGSGPDNPEPVIGEAKVEDFMNAVMADDYHWNCAGQYTSDYIAFIRSEGKNWCMITHISGMDLENDLYEVMEVKFDITNNTYIVNLREDGFDYVNFVMHVDISALRAGIIKAENLFNGEEINEYMIGEVYALRKYVMNTSDTIDRYRPSVEMFSNGRYIFVENLYEGMANVTGIYHTNGSELYLRVVDNSQMQGFAGDDLKEIGFTVSGNSIYSMQDVCFTRKGSEFFSAL